MTDRRQRPVVPVHPAVWIIAVAFWAGLGLVLMTMGG